MIRQTLALGSRPERDFVLDDQNRNLILTYIRAIIKSIGPKADH